MTQHGSRGLSHAILLATLELKLYNFMQALERRYAPDQPRVPAGNSDGGQWTSASASGTSQSNRTPTAVLVAQGYGVDLLNEPEAVHIVSEHIGKFSIPSREAAGNARGRSVARRERDGSGC